MNKTYLNTLRTLLDKLENTQENAIDAVNAVCADAVANGGLLYFFGTGHSHMICEEPFYRAGGLASWAPPSLPKAAWARAMFCSWCPIQAATAPSSTRPWRARPGAP